MPQLDKALVWFRRDLRTCDHAALFHALRQSRQVFCAFVFDRDILDLLPRHDRRVEFIHACLSCLDTELRRLGGGIIVRYGRAIDEIPKLAKELNVQAVFANHDYEPQSIARDEVVGSTLAASGRQWCSFKDQVIFEKNEVLSQSGAPFSVFTPYRNAWLKRLQLDGEACLASYSVAPHAGSLATPDQARSRLPSLTDLGFKPTNLKQLDIAPGEAGAEALLEDFSTRIGYYRDRRDFPAIKGPSYLSFHLRFGTVSIRALARLAMNAIRLGTDSVGAWAWLSELIWRDFYFMILYHHPHVVHRAFKAEYDEILWETGDYADAMSQAWSEGRTGYPLVDAAMAQLDQSGYMHNRLRMLSASFLVKDLGIDWRRGERYFAQKLNDFDLAANNGGWQWVASSGCDAQPYFRIFNPVTQSERFDPSGQFIRRYLPQLQRLPDKFIHSPWLAPPAVLRDAGVVLGRDYPLPVVEHALARERTLARYAVIKQRRSTAPSHAARQKKARV